MGIQEHSIIGPSGAHRWLKCAGSVRLAEEIANKTSSYAQEGTLAHELCERSLKRVFEHEESVENAVLEQATKMCVELDTEMTSFVSGYCNYIKDFLLTRSAERVDIEKRVTLNSDLDMFGTSDFSCIFKMPGTEKHAMFICDFKYGMGVKVEAGDNPQLAYYAAAYAGEHLDHSFDFAYCSVFQPRIKNRFGKPHISTTVFSRRELIQWRDKLVSRGSYCLTPEGAADFNTGSHCQFCNAKAICDKYASEMIEEMPESFNDELTVDDFNNDVPAIFTEDLKAVSPGMLSLDKLRALALVSSKFRSWLRSLEEYCIEKLEDEGSAIPGVKLTGGMNRRKWLEDEYTVARGLEALGVNPFRTDELRTVSSVEREIGKEAIKPFIRVVKTRGRLVADEDVDDFEDFEI